MKMITPLLTGVLLLSSSPLFAAESVPTLEGAQGKIVQLEVKSNPTTGYQWMISKLPQELIFVSSDYQQNKDCPKGAVGCSGKQTFTFIAQQAGTTSLQLIYGRAFDKTSWQEKTVAVVIK
ncbi:protease inhibitor I42 family protein [Rosenbergiella nectarea]|uniref:protease inhibitor I42 family protein n=1 Tax=Rosenbergiella nectarea TaxID=988801 RepID=UPI001BDAEA30|nr:protease inhibitor I42 family protein [Rosenbergiella nectarea]MBT0730609.1 protease inhibitor I42 family protein [Rosenbergiella nectarea subsp. apis]